MDADQRFIPIGERSKSVAFLARFRLACGDQDKKPVYQKRVA